jgi:hypothetical protein
MQKWAEIEESQDAIAEQRSGAAQPRFDRVELR